MLAGTLLDGFKDELEKIALHPAAIGAIGGGALGAIKGGLREMDMRVKEHGQSDVDVRRKGRLKYIAGTAALGAGAGATGGVIGKKLYDVGGKALQAGSKAFHHHVDVLGHKANWLGDEIAEKAKGVVGEASTKAKDLGQSLRRNVEGSTLSPKRGPARLELNLPKEKKASVPRGYLGSILVGLSLGM